MTQVLSLRVLGLLWLGLFALVAVAAPSRVMDLHLLSAVAALGIAAFLFPGVTLGLGVGLLLLAPDYFQLGDEFEKAHLSFIGIPTIQKILLLAAFGPALVRYGLRLGVNPGVLGVLVLAVVSFLFSTRYPGLTPAQIMKTLVALVLPFLFFHLKFHRRWIEPFLLMVALLPILAVLLGFVVEAAALRDVYGVPWTVVWQEYTGASRLRGVTIPAYLAIFGFVAFLVSVYQAITYRKRFFYVLAAIAFVITFLTGTRTPTVSAILFGGFAILFSSPKDLRGSAKFVFAVVGVTLTGVLLAIYWPSLEARFFSSYNEGVLNTSGRAAGYEFMLEAFAVNPVFGRGVGTGAIMFLETVPSITLDAPHSEFLRVLVEGGVVGFVAYFAGFIALFVRESRVLDRGQGILVTGMLLAFAAYSLTDNTISSPPALVLFFALAVIFAKARLARTERLAA